MNERDYMILEVMSVVLGILLTFVLMIIFLFISPELLKNMFLLLAFLVTLSFLFATMFHYRRKIYIMRMEQELVSHRKDFDLSEQRDQDNDMRGHQP